jgi:radical SAM superfamily enzyme YgiQ (UPF0313 family)
MAYPNLPLMMTPALAVALFNTICKEEGAEFRLFETTQYSKEYENRHIALSKVGANRGNQRGDTDADYFDVKPPEKIVPDFIQTVEEYQPDLILMYAQEDVVQIALKLLDSIKDKNIPHIVGGVYAMSVPEELLSEPLVNIICRYEGEEVVRQAIRSFREKRAITSIDGIWWKDENGKIHRNKPAKLVDITEVEPDYSCYENNRWERPMGGRHFYRAVAMETYRGCPYQCTYCNSPVTRDIAKGLDLGNFMRRKSADVIEKELLNFIDRGLDPDLIIFIDDSFLARPKKEIFEFAEMWSKYKVPFWFNTRIENCKPEYLQAMKEAGCYRMSFGVEAGNEEYRSKYLKRSVKNEVYHEHLRYINESNIPYSLNAIIGLPFETRELVLDTARLFHHAKGYDGVTLAIWQPYKGTELRDIAVKAGFVPEDHQVTMAGFMKFDTTGMSIKMPKPYLQPDEISKLAKTFSLYAYYPENMWELIREAETDEKLYDELMKNYKKSFYFGEYQSGGQDKIQYLNKFCAKHDISSTYQWETMVAVS